MKNILRIILLLGLSGSVLLAGCTARIYGVPKDEWQRMPPAEQQQVREAYLERQRLYEERRLYEAKQRAHEAELRAQQAREEEASRHHPAQYRDTAPDIIHFTLEGGTVYVAGRNRPFEPVTLELRQGESKRLTLQTTDDRRSYHVSLVCSYQDGSLWLSNGRSRVHARQIAYDRGWHSGQRYQNVEMGGGVSMRRAVVRVASGAIPAAKDSGRSSRPQPTPSGNSSRVIIEIDDKLQHRRHSKSDCKENSRQAECDTADKQTHQGKQPPAMSANTPGQNAQAKRDNGNNQRGNPPGQDNRGNSDHSGQDPDRQHSQKPAHSRDNPGEQGDVHSASRGNPPGQVKTKLQPPKKTEQGEGHSPSDSPAKAQSSKPHKPSDPNQSQAKAKSQDEKADQSDADAAKTKGKDKGKRQDGNNTAENCDEDDSKGKDKHAECEDETVARGKRNK